MGQDQSAPAIPRRTFLGASVVGAAHLVGAVSEPNRATASGRREDGPVRAYRYWMHGFHGAPKATAEALKAAGFDVVVAGGDKVIEAVNAAGMDSWLCGGAFGLGKHGKDDAQKARDLAGRPQVWFSSGCPNSTVLREANLESYAKMAATPGIKGILVDGCRFASPASGLDPFFTCFCPTCREKAGKLGFDFDAINRDVKALYNALTGKAVAKRRRGAAWLTSPVGVLEWLTDYPGVLDWLRFRRTCTTEHFRAVGKIIHDAKLKMGVYIFTPSIAPVVGQSYVDLREFVDVFAPMIYRNYPERPGPACLNWELTILPEELGLEGKPSEEQAMQLILAWTGLWQVTSARTIKQIRAALPPEAVGYETAMARALIGKDVTLAPIIHIDDPMMTKTAGLVRKSGASGVNFFKMETNWLDLVRPAIR